MKTNQEQDYRRVEKAIHFLGSHWREQPRLEEVAKATGLSLLHFQKLFQRWAGVSPKRFLQYLTAEYAKERLRGSRSVLDAAYESGLSGPSRLHDLLLSVEAMTPGQYKAMGEGLRIEYGYHPTPFGQALAAMTSRGLCGFVFLDKGGERVALASLKKKWPRAIFVLKTEVTRPIVEKIFEPSSPKKGIPLKVILQGTPFQLKVWEALLRIPMGHLAAYQDVAKGIGKPKAARAVGTAIGQNAIAYLIPCHRVIQETGMVGNYRWGSDRKKAMLAWEAEKFKTKI